MRYYSVTRTGANLLHVPIWVNLINMMIKETIQEKMCCMSATIKWFKNKQNTPLGRMEWGEVRNGADGVLVFLSFFTSVVITY